MRDAVPWIIAGFIALALLVLAAPPDQTVEMAPDFSLLALDGQAVTLSSFRGSVVIIDFWAGWCTPCLRTLPDLHALADRYAEEGVVFLAVSLDRTADAASEYASDLGLSEASVLYESRDAARAVKTLFGVVGIPRTFVVDREGWIRYSGSPTGVTDDVIETWLQGG